MVGSVVLVSLCRKATRKRIKPIMKKTSDAGMVKNMNQGRAAQPQSASLVQPGVSQEPTRPTKKGETPRIGEVLMTVSAVMRFL